MYTPASNITTQSSFNHLATVYYDRVALDQLRTVTMFWKGVDERVHPKRNGKTVQFFRYGDFGANTTPTVEGQVPTGLQMSTTSFTATVSQYDDYITISDFLDDTSISDEVTAAADQLGYRAALTTDEILKAEIDSAAGSVDLALLGSNFSAKDAANVRHQLQGLNIRPKSNDGYFEALIHPYVSYDLIKDPEVGGFQDLVKRGARQNNRLFTLEDRGFLAEIHGVRFWESTNVTQVSGSPNKWRVYFFGEGGVSAIDLAGRGPSRVMRPPNGPNASGDRFRVNVVRGLGPSKADPTGKIRAFISYNFVFVAKIMDSTNYRFRKIDAPSSIVS